MREKEREKNISGTLYFLVLLLYTSKMLCPHHEFVKMWSKCSTMQADIDGLVTGRMLGWRASFKSCLMRVNEKRIIANLRSTF